MDIQEYVQNNFLHLPFFVEALKKKARIIYTFPQGSFD